MQYEQIIYQRFRASYKARMKALWREELRAEFIAAPEALHSPDLEAILTYFRLAEVKGKLLIVATRHWEEFRIARLSGVHGSPIEYLSGQYASAGEAALAVFDMRIAELLR